MEFSSCLALPILLEVSNESTQILGRQIRAVRHPCAKFVGGRSRCGMRGLVICLRHVVFVLVTRSACRAIKSGHTSPYTLRQTNREKIRIISRGPFHNLRSVCGSQRPLVPCVRKQGYTPRLYPKVIPQEGISKFTLAGFHMPSLPI